MNDLLTPTEYRVLLLLLTSGPLAQGICLLKNRDGKLNTGMLCCSLWGLSCGFVLMNCNPDEIGRPMFLFSFVPIISGLSGLLSWLSHHLPERRK